MVSHRNGRMANLSAFAFIIAVVATLALALHGGGTVTVAEASSLAVRRGLLGGSEDKCYYGGVWTDSGDWYSGPTHTCKCDDGDWKYCKPHEDDDDGCYDEPTCHCDSGYDLEVCEDGVKICVKYAEKDPSYYCDEDDGWKVEDDGDKCYCVKVIYEEPELKCDSGWSLEKDSYGNYNCVKKWEKEPECDCQGW